MKHLARVVWSLGFVAALAAAPATAQQVKDNWSDRWYWGAHVGGMGYATATQQTYWDPMIGAHWFITKKRIALYTAAEQAFFTADAHTVIAGRVATFSEVRRFVLGLVALPKRGYIEPYFGGGFMIAYIVNPKVDCTGCTATEQGAVNTSLADQSTSAFAWGMGGAQMNLGPLSLFGHYMITDAGGFMIQGAMHAIQVGARWSFGSATESVIRD